MKNFILLLLLLLAPAAFCDPLQSWEDYIAGLRVEALRAGIRPNVFDQAFLNVSTPNTKILRLDRNQPEKRLSFLEYRNSRVDHFRIQLGKEAFRRHQEALNNISRQYGVSPCFIVSLWGLETSYGHFKGNFPVIRSLATLAYNNRRKDFFHSELMVALHMLNNGQVTLSQFKGEWAGASGHCQFMPSTWVKYAVPYQGVGYADIWNNVDDALASIANYLQKSGWHRNEPWALAVSLPSNFHAPGLNITKSVREWSQLGIRPLIGSLPAANLPASIINPDGGPAYMVFNNFKTLLKWNHSNYYAGAVGYLADSICQIPELTPEPVREQAQASEPEATPEQELETLSSSSSTNNTEKEFEPELTVTDFSGTFEL